MVMEQLARPAVQAAAKTGFMATLGSWLKMPLTWAGGVIYRNPGKSALTALGTTAAAGTMVDRSGDDAGVGNGIVKEAKEARDGFVSWFTGKKEKSDKPLFGVGSLITGGLLYAAGHFVLDSPLLGLGMAGLGVIAGQPIIDAIEAYSKSPPATPKKGEEPKKETNAPEQKITQATSPVSHEFRAAPPTPKPEVGAQQSNGIV